MRYSGSELDVNDVACDANLGSGDDEEFLEGHVQMLRVADGPNEVCAMRVYVSKRIQAAPSLRTGSSGPKISSPSIGSGASLSSSVSPGPSTIHREPSLDVALRRTGL